MSSDPATTRGGTPVRTAGIVAMLVGIGLIVTPLVTSMFSRTTAANHLTDTVRPAMSQAAFASATTDLNSVVTAFHQLTDELVPALATQAHQSPTEFVGELQATYPQIKAGLANFNTAVANARRILAILTAQRANYDSADSLPVSGVPVTAAPWAYLAAGVVFFLLGLGCLLRRSAAALVALLVVALGIAIVPLATSQPSKLSDTKALVNSLRTTLSPQAAATARMQYTTFATMLAVFDTKTLPAFATATHQTDAQLAQTVTEKAPLLVPGQPDVQRILAKFGGLTVALVSQVNNYHRTEQLPLKWLAWLFVIPGFVLAALAGVALVSRRRAPMAV
jgi:hypothetical protein